MGLNGPEKYRCSRPNATFLKTQAKQILSAALGRMLILLGSGSVVGIVLGAAASRLLSAVVYQAPAHDPFVLAAVAFTTVLNASLSAPVP
jgi:hypothetical protein